jgi:hypothetical protein
LEQLAKENAESLVSHFDSAARWTAFFLPGQKLLKKQKRNWPSDQENRHIDPRHPPTEIENEFKRPLLSAQFFLAAAAKRKLLNCAVRIVRREMCLLSPTARRQSKDSRAAIHLRRGCKPGAG